MIAAYYQTTGKIDKANHFFRNGGAQDKFREEHKLGSDEAADHIISTAVFRTILENYSNPKLTYDYYASIKTSMNQCWNFQRLSKKDNSKKSTTEVALIGYIKDRNKKPSEECNRLVVKIKETIEKAIGNGKDLFAQSMAVRDAVDNFLQDFGFETIDWTVTGRLSCPCEVCVYARGNSKRWRLKYYVFYQKTKTPDQINSTFEKMCLYSLLEKNFGTKFQEEIKKCEEMGINTIMQYHYYLKTTEKPKISEQMALRSLNTRVTKKICAFFNRKRKTTAIFDGIKSLLDDSFSFMIPDNVKTVLENALTTYSETNVTQWVNDFSLALNKCK